MSNPSRHGIAFSTDADVNVIVFDVAGRVVAKQAAARGANFVPLSKAGVYAVKVVDDRSTTTKVVVGP